MATFTKRGNKYFVQIRRKGFATACRSFHLKSDAEQWARHMETKADRGELLTSFRVLDTYKLSDILTRYRSEITPKKRGALYEGYVIDAFLRLPMAKLTLAQITTAHFSAYREKRLKEVSPATINRQLGVIRHAFDTAMREWDIPMRENPVAKLRRYRVNNARTRRLEEGEYTAIEIAIGKCRNKLMLPFVKLAIETAMRRSELLGLEWKHIDFGARTLLIPLTKNGHSRTIPLTIEAVNILRAIQEMKLDKCCIFHGLTANAVHLAWDRIVKRAGIDDLRFHDLRHESISRFFERGLSVPEVALISGHRDFRMLFRYTHLKAEDVAMKL